VQWALERLVQDGLIETRGRQGTFITPEAPHLNRYALAFPTPREWLGHSKFWEELVRAAVRVGQGSARRVEVFHDIEFHASSTDYQALRRDISRGRLAGVIFGGAPWVLESDDLLRRPALPMVAVMSGQKYAGVPAVFVDRAAFVERALADLAARGRRRVAMLSTAMEGSPAMQRAYVEQFEERVAHHGLSSRPYWLQMASAQGATAARQIVHLMLGANPADRPDALIVCDDHLVEQSTAGVLAAGLRAPQDVEVVAYCNFPTPPPALVPVRRLGFSAPAVIDRCIEVIDLQRRGVAVPALSLIPPHFEEELI
jgi:hypothetical protein